MTTVLITGAGGFIARHLALTLKEAGMRVLGTSRSARDLPGFDRIYPARLGDSLRSLFDAEAVDSVVHTALAAGPDEYRANVEGTTRWLEEAASASPCCGRGRQRTVAGVGLQILLSSLSADAAALSDYGRAKYELERRLIAADQVVFRLGIVVGDGGMFGRMVESVRRSPVVPLLDGGRQRVYVLGIGCLCDVIRDAVAGGGGPPSIGGLGGGLTGRAWNLQQPTPHTLAELLAAIADGYGLRRLFLPVPTRPILLLLRLFEKQRLVRLPVTSINVQGLIQAEQHEPPSDFSRFGCREVGLDALVAAAARSTGHHQRS